MKTIIRYLAIVALFAAVGGAALLFTPLGERPLAVLLPVGDVETVDFAALKLTGKPNQYLLCPTGFCGANPNADSPVFDVPVARLLTRWREVVAAQPRVELLSKDGDGRQIDYIQRSARFRFPDIVTVRFISVSPSQSALAIYSRSIYGESDFGVNRKRIDSWLTFLREGL